MHIFNLFPQDAPYSEEDTSFWVESISKTTAKYFGPGNDVNKVILGCHLMRLCPGASFYTDDVKERIRIRTAELRREFYGESQ